jgi:hypothetical protein
MAISVWVFYAADRLMDSRVLDVDPTNYNEPEARHYFHHRYRAAFITGIIFASAALAVLLPRLDVGALHIYLFLRGLVSGYFALIHAVRNTKTRQKVAHRLPKEFAVGLLFAAAIFVPTIARRPDLRLSLLPFALLFATLCSLNCLFIYAWEHDDSRTSTPPHALTHFALKYLPSLAVLLTLSGAAIALFDHRATWPVPYAIALSAAVLLLLHTHRLAITPVTLRTAADLALTTPLLLTSRDLCRRCRKLHFVSIRVRGDARHLQCPLQGPSDTTKLSLAKGFVGY